MKIEKLLKGTIRLEEGDKTTIIDNSVYVTDGTDVYVIQSLKLPIAGVVYAGNLSLLNRADKRFIDAKWEDVRNI